MKKKKQTKSVLEELISNREENILMASKRSDAEIDEMITRYMEASKCACELNNFESYKVHEEKLSQLFEAKHLKFSYSDEASDWIHW
jgi:predicted CopG family antitoxin